MHKLLEEYIVNLKEQKSEYRVVSRSINSRKDVFENLIELTPHLSIDCSTTEKLYCILNDITVSEKCPYCEKCRAFRSTSKGYSITCGDKTCVNTAQQVTIRINNPIHYFQTETFKKAHKKKMNEKYGSDNYFSSEIGKSKVRLSLIEKYGVDNPARIASVQDRICYTRSKNSTEKYTKILENNNEIIVNWKSDGSTEIHCNDCKTNSVLSNSFFAIRAKRAERCCTKCNPIERFSSTGEKELQDFIEELGFEISRNDRTMGFEIDALVKSMNVAFEFNGTYWHSELFKYKKFHLEKSKKCEAQNVSLYHVWQSDWEQKKDLVKSRIRRVLGKTPTVIAARKCKVEKIDNKTASSFFDNNHVMGNSGRCTVMYGLFSDNTIVAAISVGKSRFKKGEIELLRYATHIDFSIIGGFEKMMKQFSRDFPNETLITYCDKSWGRGDFYSKKGFTFIGETPVDFWYMKDGCKVNRFTMRSKIMKENPDSKFEEIVKEKKIYRTYGCGSTKWSFISNPSE